MTDLPSLIERLKAAEGPDWKLDIDIAQILDVPVGPKLTTSLDATIALVDRHGLVWLKKSPTTMTVYRPLTDEQEARKEWPKHFSATGANSAIALIKALFYALQEQEEGR